MWPRSTLFVRAWLTQRISSGVPGAPNVAWASARLGGHVRFIGIVGSDHYGSAFQREFTDAGIELHLVQRGKSAVVVAFVDQAGERTFAADMGDASIYPADIPESAVDGIGILHLTVYELTSSHTAEAALHLVGLAHARQTPLTVDLGSANLVEELGPSGLSDLLKRIRPLLVFANDDEFRVAWPGGRPSHGEYLVVRKRGSSSTRLYSSNGRLCGTSTVPHVTEVVDTTGAGDAFAGAFLFGWMAGMPVADVCRLAHHTAQSVIRRLGARL